MADAEITADEDCPECYVQGVCLSLLASTIQSMGYCCWKVREQCRCLAAGTCMQLRPMARTPFSCFA